MLNIKSKHYYNPKFEIEHYRKIKKPKQVQIYDKLFYCLYHKIKKKYNLDKYNETLEKIKIIEYMKNINIKHKNELIEHMYKENIPLCCLVIITKIWDINVIWYSNYCYCEFINNENDIYFLSDKYEWTENVELNNKYKIENIFKPIKCMSYYKLDDLKIISNYFNVNGKKKKELYDGIVYYLENLKLI